MSDESTVQGLKVSVTFDRKVSDGDYGSIECRAWVEGDVPAGSDASAVVAKLQEAFAAAKVVVLDELAIPYVMDDNGVVREKAIPRVGAVVSPETRLDHATGGGGHTIKVMNKGMENHSIPADVVEKIVAAGVTAVWVNEGNNGGTYYKEALTKAQRDANVKARTFS